jgi:hypothetical protein
MTSSAPEWRPALAQQVTVSDEALTVELTDGRSIAVPLVWFPRLLHGSAQERSRWQLIGHGEGIHWPELDEDVSVTSLLAGRRSDEAPASLRRWLDARQAPAAG